MKRKVDFRLILITDRKLNNNLPLCISKACTAGVKAVMVREKDLPANELLSLSKNLKTITGKTKTKLIINDRYDIALLSGADGVHSPENGITPKQISQPDKFLIGRSVHSTASAKEAEKLGFDYLLFGPVYRTPAKIKYGSPMGLKKLKEVCGSVNIPVFAVGGINLKRAKKCMLTGAFGIAVIREIMLSGNIKHTVKEFKDEMGDL